jgi:hypothetical protein
LFSYLSFKHCQALHQFGESLISGCHKSMVFQSIFMSPSNKSLIKGFFSLKRVVGRRAALGHPSLRCTCTSMCNGISLVPDSRLIQSTFSKQKNHRKGGFFCLVEAATMHFALQAIELTCIDVR